MIWPNKINQQLDPIITNRELEGFVSSTLTCNIVANIQWEAVVNKKFEIIDLIDDEIKEK